MLLLHFVFCLVCPTFPTGARLSFKLITDYAAVTCSAGYRGNDSYWFESDQNLASWQTIWNWSAKFLHNLVLRLITMFLTSFPVAQDKKRKIWDATLQLVAASGFGFVPLSRFSVGKFCLFIFLISACIWRGKKGKRKRRERRTWCNFHWAYGRHRSQVLSVGSWAVAFGEEWVLSVPWRALLPPRCHPRRLHWLVVDCGKC